MTPQVTVVGAGLAGCEAAWALAQAGVPVLLREMKPEKYSPAHTYPGFAELVCSNSLKAMRLESAAGLLKEEMRMLGSVTMEAAARTAVSAGGALAVDRRAFSDEVTGKIRSHPLIQVEEGEVTRLPQGPVILATGPLTSQAFTREIETLCGGKGLSFFDAAAPIVTAASLDQEKIFYAARYDRGEADYINCPMSKAEYEAFYQELIHGETAPLHDFDQASPQVYEGCMPIEVLAKRGEDAIRYGPLKPVGLRDPRTGHRPWAVVQLRRENAEGSLYNMVGFQTNLKFGEQKRIFSLIPGLEQAEFVRYGVMHRNTFIDSPPAAGAHLFPAGRAAHRLCRADYRGGGIYRVGRLRHSGGEEHGPPPGRPPAPHPPPGDDAGRPGRLYQRPHCGQLSAHGQQYGDPAAPGQAHPGQAPAVCPDCPAGGGQPAGGAGKGGINCGENHYYRRLRRGQRPPVGAARGPYGH